MNTPKKPHPSQRSMPLSGDQVFAPPIPIVRKKTVFNPEMVCAYMSAVLLDEIVMGEQKPPVKLEGRK